MGLFQRVIATLLVISTLSFSTAANAHYSDIRNLYTLLEEPMLEDQHHEIIRHLSDKRYYEVQFALYARFIEEINHHYDQIDYELVREILVALKKVGTADHLPSFQEHITNFIIRARQFSRWHEMDMDSLINQMSISMRKRKTLPSLAADEEYDLLRVKNLLSAFSQNQSLIDDSESVASVYDRVHKFMSDRVIGQPLLVEKITQIISNDAIFRTRQKPQLFYMMGQPGTGKDTAVRAMVDAIHMKEGAWESEENLLEIGAKSEKELWNIIGSASGYVDSSNVPPLLQFMVDHSGGRYKFEFEKTSQGTSFRVIENDEWHGQNLPGHKTPEEAVLFINEFHDWSKKIKNSVLKRLFEHGSLTINNPNGGVSEIRVPVTIAIASNEGIGLVTSRDAAGKRRGKPLSFLQSFKMWERVKDNIEVLKNELKKTGLDDLTNDSTGNSEEMISRIPDDRLILMKPLSQEEIKQILEIKLNSLKKFFLNSYGKYSKVYFQWDESVLEFLVNYNFVSEDGARPMDSRVEALITETIKDAIRAGKIPENQEATVNISAEALEDGTHQLIFDMQSIDKENMGHSTEKIEMLIRETVRNKPSTPLTDEEIDHMIEMSGRMKKKLFGAEKVIDRVAEALFITEERRRANHNVEKAKKGARSFMFLGPSSTGKTELAKVMAEEIYGDREEIAVLDFNGVSSKEQVHELIYGKKNARGISEPSDFMLEYDKRGGKLIILLDEIANVKDPEALVPLYALLDEPLVSHFSDGQERNMTDVIIVMTGNAGEEWYQGIPGSIPDEVQRMARDEIYAQKTSNPYHGRMILEKYFREAFINRVGEQNIMFFPSLSHRAQRELINLKMKLMLDGLRPTKSGVPRGWNIGFVNEDTYQKFVSEIEDDIFGIKEQGRSVDIFINEVLGSKLNSTLLHAKFPNAADVILTYEGYTEAKEETEANSKKTFKIKATDGQSGQSIIIEFAGRNRNTVAETTEVSKITTAFHEAGHAVVGHTFFSEYRDPIQVKIIPGVAEIGGEMIYYAGLASQDHKAHPEMTREMIVREIAILAGGYMAESIVTKGERHTAGKSNDMQRATEDFADRAILQWGLSDEWGYELARDGQSLQEFKASLPEGAKELLRKERLKLLAEGEALARKAILINFGTFTEMANQLAEKGELKRTEMNEIFTSGHFVPEKQWGLKEKLKARYSVQAIKAKWNKVVGKMMNKTMEVEIRGDIKTPEKIANIEQILKDRKSAELTLVDNHTMIPVAEIGPNTCKEIFESLLQL